MPEVLTFLRDRGADHIEHPGGTLLAHLRRVAATLAAWGADADIETAGLCHATYGTDGFDRSLLDVSRRGELRDLVGERPEALVYLYGSLDRAVVYPRLGGPPPVTFRDRFTGREFEPVVADVRAVVEITAANELDVLAHNAELAARHEVGLRRLFERSRDLLSAPARAAWRIG
jgi:xanthine/CO dehydrogenase XdhC/CoxF family maturation factor